MLRWPILLSCALLAPPAIAQAVDAPEPPPLMADLAGNVARPGYEAFAMSTRQVRSDIDALCERPAPPLLAAARAAFLQLVPGWGRVEYIRFGPAAQGDRAERILFWPDRRGLGMRQIRQLVAAQDPAATNAASLAKKSVAVQGLLALEYLLYGDGSEAMLEAGSFRCAYAAAVAANIGDIAGDLLDGWRDGPAVDPGASDAAKLLIGTLVQGLENIRDTRLAFLGEEASQDRPRQAPFWRSDATFDLLRADIAGLRSIFEGSGMAALLPEDARSIAGSIRFEFDQLDSYVSSIDGPVEAALRDPGRRAKLVLVDLVLDSLIERFDDRFAEAAGLPAGFSFGDGD